MNPSPSKNLTHKASVKENTIKQSNEVAFNQLSEGDFFILDPDKSKTLHIKTQSYNDMLNAIEINGTLKRFCDRDLVIPVYDVKVEYSRKE